jgi:septum site-determining protein MinC
MPVALAGATPATFEIKSATLPLVALLLKTADLAQLERDMAQRFGDAPDFFDNDPLVLDLAPLREGGAGIDYPALVQLLRRHRVHTVAVKGGSPAQMEEARRAGLALAPDAVVHKAARATAPPPVAVPTAAPQPPAPTSALVIDKPLRSGQQVYARGRDLVVLSMVNPGAEVMADGHIHVYAPLRGKAMAGARGNTLARIFSLALEAELVSIAGVYRTSETPLPDALRGKPAMVRLDGDADSGKLVLEPLTP